MATTAQPQLDGNDGIMPCPQELAGICSTKAVELLLVDMLRLLCLPGADNLFPGPVALLESHVLGLLLLLLDLGYADVLGEVVEGIIPCVES